ncbi:MAG: hypothetical protein ACRDJ5_03355 [Actinomycetota bacterium]
MAARSATLYQTGRVAPIERRATDVTCGPPAGSRARAATTRFARNGDVHLTHQSSATETGLVVFGPI